MGKDPEIHQPKKAKSVHKRRGHLPHKKELHARRLPKHQRPLITNRQPDLQSHPTKPPPLKIPLTHLLRQAILNLQTREISRHHHEDQRRRSNRWGALRQNVRQDQFWQA